MAYEEGLHSITLVAGADLSDYQYHLVKASASGEVNVCTDAGDRAIGILQNKPEDGQAATVGVRGVSKFAPGADIDADDCIGPDASSNGIATTTAAHFAIGVALEDHEVGATPDDELATVLLTGPFHPAVS